jgi:lipopolysaccharide transport system ATP-binding protein
MPPAIQLLNVSKGFHRFSRRREIVRGLLSRAGIGSPGEPFWALKNISLDIPKGQTWGIVGRNGSGKSTLLQIIAGTLEPTEGEVQVYGRVAALLELGSGFHPEFTGRENVFFQGQLQGCSRAQILDRIDQIVDFASIGDFLDQPVKTYSSGMMLRLAFAVTITLDPDILIVDEALAVGDEAFQRKCFGRIRALRDAGCTVLFVSHSGQHIIELCDRALLLDAGEPLLIANPKQVISWYHKLLFAAADQASRIREEIRTLTPDAEPAATAAPAPVEATEDFDPSLVPQSTVNYPSRGAEIIKPRITRPDGTPVNVLSRGEPYRYTYRVRFLENHPQVRFGMMLKTTTGLELGGATSHSVQHPVPAVDSGETCEISFEFQCLLQAGIYFANAGVTSITPDGEIYIHRIVDAVMFRVKHDPASIMTGTIDFNILPSVTRVPDHIPSA